VTLGDGDFRKFPYEDDSLMKMTYRKLLKTASLPVTSVTGACIVEA
jgi:hypothetical protein